MRDADGLSEYLYKVQPTRPQMLTEGLTPEEDQAVEAHFEYLRDLAEQGVVLLAGRTRNTDPTSFGIVIFRAGSVESAREMMEGDPAVRAGVFRAELYPYSIALVGALRDVGPN
ncbi:MAG: hypothetical protein JXB46_06490 [Candidatus Eisenbacteria bacterium]|nr:hypothetical protein [Candidatus Eisenbacteria bacterium]